MTRMSRDFTNGTEMRLFLWGLMNNEEWGSEAASYTEQYQFITVVLPLGEGVDARIGASVKDLQATLKFTGNVGESETFSKMAGLRQVFREEQDGNSEHQSCFHSVPGITTGDLPDTGMTVNGAALAEGDLYSSYDNYTGGSFHGC